MNIFQISLEQQRINTMLEESGGELTPEIEEALLINEDNFLSKAEAYSASIMAYKADSDALDSEIKRLQALKKTAGNTVERLKKSLADAMITFDCPKLDLGTYKISFRKSESVSVDENASLPEKYQSIEIDYDRTLIKNDLKSGIEIPGASIVVKENLQIR